MEAAEAAEPRDQWGYKIEPILSCLSLSFGLGNIWRFPYLTYKNGGGVPVVMMYTVFLTSIYYNVISSYALAYFYYSLWKVQPWTTCNPEWTNEYCFVQGSVFKSCKEANESLLILFGRVNSTESDAVAINNGSVVIMVPRDEFEARYKGCKNANETSMEQFF
ncbi:hypothetical protein HPB52_006360 [Rhipicephalus sanguineus]|uniref:Transporter n=1 Tax=Rhipicephalus sanguineus TaxID=34632 RepID=A0A9D4QCH7_RHISA|nr:hypothetical protein HPB52_006360 [Rhipicephalus sanguineus]